MQHCTPILLHYIWDMKKHGTYGALLFRTEWKEKRKLILERDSSACVICGSAERLVVHHRQYTFIKPTQKFKDPWDYPNSSLITLCTNCHNRGHYKFQVPIVYIE